MARTNAQVTDAPVEDAPVEGTPDAPASDPTPITAGMSRRDRVKAEAAARKAEVPRFTLDEGADWRETGTGRVAVCNSRPNAQGKSFTYAVYQPKNGREVAIPLAAIYSLEEAGDL
jgi:hypothetical protein